MFLYMKNLVPFPSVEATLMRWKGSRALRSKVDIPAVGVSITNRFYHAGQVFFEKPDKLLTYSGESATMAPHVNVEGSFYFTCTSN